MARKAWRDGYVSAHVSNTIASQITKLRIANGWTQTELAKQVGMKQSRISALEDPNLENVEVVTLERIASAFDVAMTVRFIPFSELAQWAATLTEAKLLVPTYEEEAADKVSIRSVAKAGAAAAFIAGLNQQPFARGSVYDEARKMHSQIVSASQPKRDDLTTKKEDPVLGALAASIPLNQNEFPRQVAA